MPNECGCQNIKCMGIGWYWLLKISHNYKRFSFFSARFKMKCFTRKNLLTKRQSSPKKNLKTSSTQKE